MSRRNILISVFVLLILFAIGFYVYDVAVVGTPYNENLFKVIILVISLTFSVFRVAQRTQSEERKPLSFYENSYREQLENVYSHDNKSRKKLLNAIRYYNENNFERALSLLSELKNKRPVKKEINVIYLFSALCYTDMGMNDAAVREYELMLVTEPENSTVLSNLGMLYERMGNYERSKECYIRAIEVKPENHYAINNLAQLYFTNGEFILAIDYSLKALEICPNFRPSATLLAIIYGAYGDTVNYEKYLRVATENGADADAIEKIAVDVRFSIEEDDYGVSE